MCCATTGKRNLRCHPLLHPWTALPVQLQITARLLIKGTDRKVPFPFSNSLATGSDSSHLDNEGRMTA